MQQDRRYNYWNLSPNGTWNGQKNPFPVFRPNQSAYINANRVGSTLSKDTGNGEESTPLPRVRNQSGSPSKVKSSSNERFWTFHTETSPEKKSIFAGKEMYNKFLASFRKKKAKALATSEVIPTDKDANSPAKPLKPESERVTARVLLLDGEEVSMEINKRAFGFELIQRICDGQDIIETDYFGITFTDKKLGTWFWLDLDKKIIKQVANVTDWQFYFQVKFYPPEPTMLQDEMTRYQLVLQVRQDVYTGKLPCSWVTQALLGSFLVQSELGDYNLDSQGPGTNYLRQFEFIRNPTDQLFQKIMELHKTHKGMKPGQADIKYLETAKRLDLYGLDLHPARDMENVEIYIGVGYSGIVIYRDRVRIGRFAWPKVLRISYKKNYFYLKIRPDYTEPEEAVVGFALLNPQLAKRLWKTAVEHHAFFRLKEPRATKRGPMGFLTGSSRFQYSGRTFFQYRTAHIDRPAEMVDDDNQVDDNGRPRHQRTPSVPAALNRAGLRYNSIHSLNRTHPRDMTIGKVQSNDYLGPPKQNASGLMGNNSEIIQSNVAASHPALFRPITNSRPPHPQPLSRRNQYLPNGQSYLDNEGSLFDGMSSRGEGSLIESGMRGVEYEVPRQLGINGFSSYAYEKGDLSMMSGDDVGTADDMEVVSASSVAWSASNSYNPRPSQNFRLSPQATPIPSTSPYFPRPVGQQRQYANVGDSGGYSDNASETQNIPARPNRRTGPYVRKDL